MVVVVLVTGLADPVGLFACPAAVEIAWLAFLAALEMEALVASDPQALRGTIAVASASAARTRGMRTGAVIPDRLRRMAGAPFALSGAIRSLRDPLRGERCAQWGGQVPVAGAGTTHPRGIDQISLPDGGMRGRGWPTIGSVVGAGFGGLADRLKGDDDVLARIGLLCPHRVFECSLIRRPPSSGD